MDNIKTDLRRKINWSEFLLRRKQLQVIAAKGTDAFSSIARKLFTLCVSRNWKKKKKRGFKFILAKIEAYGHWQAVRWRPIGVPANSLQLTRTLVYIIFFIKNGHATGKLSSGVSMGIPANSLQLKYRVRYITFSLSHMSNIGIFQQVL